MKTVRTRKCRKNSSGKNRIGKRAVQALAAGTAIAAGTQAYADPVRFDNPAQGEPGYFQWPNPSPALWLDMMLDAASQPGSMGPTSLKHWPAMYGSVSGAGAEVGEDATGYVLVPFDSGEMIDGAGNWGASAYVDFPFYGHSALLPQGQPTYLAVRFPENGIHYGWIGVVRTGYALDAFAWGYETEPGVPVPAGAPEPGTLALLAFGAAALLRRR